MKLKIGFCLGLLVAMMLSSCIESKMTDKLKFGDDVQREYFVVDGFRYELCEPRDEDYVSVVSLENEEYRGDINIPESVTYKGRLFRVNNIGADAFKGCKNLNSVVIGDNIQVVGSNAFENSSIREVDISEGVQIIGADAFRNCDNLAKVILDSIQVVGSDAFYDCDGLKFVEINNVQIVGVSAFKQCDNMENAYLSKVQIIGEESFADCNKNLQIVGSDIQIVKKNAFRGCVNVKIN